MRWNEGTDGDEGDDNLCKYILKLVLGISEKKIKLPWYIR